MKLTPGDMQAFADIYNAFLQGERRMGGGRETLRALVNVYSLLDTLTVPARAPDGSPARIPVREGGELSGEPDLFRALVMVATPVLTGEQRACDARRALAALDLLDRMTQEG